MPLNLDLYPVFDDVCTSLIEPVLGTLTPLSERVLRASFGIGVPVMTLDELAADLRVGPKMALLYVNNALAAARRRFPVVVSDELRAEVFG